MMGGVDPKKRRLVGAVLNRAFTMPLDATGTIALECLSKLASAGVEASQENIRAATGLAGQGTVSKVINRLVAKGYVEHVMGHPLQRSIWVRIIETGETTAEPKCKSPHWRYRTDLTQTPAIQSVRERSKSLADMIEAKARDLKLPLHEFLMSCVYVGYHEISHEHEEPQRTGYYSGGMGER